MLVLSALAVLSLVAAAPLEQRDTSSAHHTGTSTASARSASATSSSGDYYKFFDLQGHRGGRGEYIESTLPAFAHALKAGATSLEFDVGITADGEAIVWHDEKIDATKCKDTKAAFAGDSAYPYVGKSVVNLTLAQIKTLDCGSLRLDGFPLAITVAGTKISTLREFFSFVKCSTDLPVLFNAESKVNPVDDGATKSPEEFVRIMHAIFKEQGADVLNRITLQSFDWRTLILSKQLMPELRTSALADDTTIYRTGVTSLVFPTSSASPWLGGVSLDMFNGTMGERVAKAAHSIKANYLSSVAVSYASAANDFGKTGFVAFTTPDMVAEAHRLGLLVKPWTPNRLNLISYLLDIGVDGIITDHPQGVRPFVLQRNYNLPGKSEETRVDVCLKKDNQLARA